MSDFDIDDALEAFRDTIQTKANPKDRVGERTANSYERNVRFFVEWLDDERDKTPLEATTSDLRVYLQSCVKDGDKPNTVKTRRSAVSRFYDELPQMAQDDKLTLSEADCPDNPEEGYDATWSVSETHMEEQTGEELHYLKPEQVTELRKNVPAPKLRNRLIVRLLYSTAMRVSELINVRLHHINRDERTISVPSVTSKGDSRTVAYKDTVVNDLRRWIDGGYRDAEHYAEESDYLFPTAQAEKISRETVRTVILEAIENSPNIQNRVIYTDNQGNKKRKYNVHTLRHSAACNLLDAGVLNVREIQEFLGHSDLETSESYLKIVSKDATDKYIERGGPPEGD